MGADDAHARNSREFFARFRKLVSRESRRSGNFGLCNGSAFYMQQFVVCAHETVMLM